MYKKKILIQHLSYIPHTFGEFWGFFFLGWGECGKLLPSPFSFVPIFLSFQAVNNSCSFSVFFPPSILLLTDNQCLEENLKGRIPFPDSYCEIIKPNQIPQCVGVSFLQLRTGLDGAANYCDCNIASYAIKIFMASY
jgi:hypothetical protein